MELAATRIQAIMRGKKSRVNTPRSWKEKAPPLKPKKPPPKPTKIGPSAEELEQQELELAAVKIQSAMRGKRARKPKKRAPPMKPKRVVATPPPSPMKSETKAASWDKADTNGDGSLDMEEVRSLLSAMGSSVSDALFEEVSRARHSPPSSAPQSSLVPGTQ